MAIIVGSGEMSANNTIVGVAATAASTSSGAYLLFSLNGLINIWVPERAGIITGISASFVNTVNSASTVYYSAYAAGSAFGPVTPSKTMTTTMTYAAATGGTATFAAGIQLEIACYPSGSPGGTLYSQVMLSVLYQ